MLVNLVFAAAAEGAAPANPVSFDFWTLLWQSLNVLIVMGVLYYMLFRPVAGIMKRREEFVEESLSSAASARKEAEELLAQYKARLDQARAEAQQIVEKAAREAEEYGRKRREEADAEAQAMIEKAKAEIEAEREKALSAIRDEMATLAVLAASKVIGRAIQKEDHERLVQEFVAKVGERN